MGRFISLVVRNVWRNRRSTLLTILSNSVFFCLLGTMLAVWNALYFSGASPSEALRLVVRNRTSLAMTLPMYYGEKIRRIPGVREAMVLQWFGGAYKDSRDTRNFFARMAVEGEKIFAIRPEMQLPDEEKRKFVRERSACLVGRTLASRLNFRTGDRITLTGDIFPVTLELTVRGVFDAPENSDILYFHWKYLEESVSSRLRDVGLVGRFQILAESPDVVTSIAHSVDEMFRNSAVQTRTEPEHMFSLTFLSSLGNIKAVLLTVCAAAVFSMLLVTANTIAMMVRERIREVGVLRTLGFSSGQIMTILIEEAVVIASAGAAVGLLLSAALCTAVRHGPLAIEVLRNLQVQPAVALIAFGLAISVGVISCLPPAWHASRIPIVEAIRHSG